MYFFFRNFKQYKRLRNPPKYFYLPSQKPKPSSGILSVLTKNGTRAAQIGKPFPLVRSLFVGERRIENKVPTNQCSVVKYSVTFHLFPLAFKMSSNSCTLFG
ncbi:hypothetical protein CDAR_485351 [Caerostris darwini]|uniref:Ribosomal protein S12 n=1 Tax=Caerostris darwini TaxID=1538125 RepID=A0AAV4PAS4_9ARAC|nr:hypothetical protein CDAR_485351 [Caerostris darwini]